MFESLGDKYVYLVVFASSLSAFSTGTALTWSSPIIAKLTNETFLNDNPLGRIITSNEKSWIGSLLQLGGVIGALLFAYLNDKIGRRLCVILCGVPLLTAYIILTFAKDISLYYVARILSGLGVGGTFTVAILYVGEIAAQTQRGLLCSTTVCFIISGLLFSYVTGPYMSIFAYNLSLAVFPAALIILFGLVGPESPYYLISKNRQKEAKDVLMKLRGTTSEEIDEELKEICLNCEALQVQTSLWGVFRSKAARRSLFIVCSINIFQQFSGINIILAYTQSIFSATGSDIDDAVSSIISGAVQLATCFVTPVLSDKLGRRILFIFSVSGVAIFQAVFGVYFYLQDQKINMDSVSWLPIVTLVVYLVFFNSGFGSLPAVITGEFFPLEIKSIGSAMANCCYFGVGFLLSYYFNGVSEAIGMGQTFWICSGVCVGTVVFIYFFLFETKGKSLQEIQDILNS